MWGEAVEGGAVVVEFLRPSGGEGVECHAGLLGVADGFVVDIGEVADVFGVLASEFDDAAEDVLQDEGAEVADVRRSVDGRSATVEPQCFAIYCLHGLKPSGLCVVQVQHGRIST